MTRIRIAIAALAASTLAACAGMLSQPEGGWMTLLDGERGIRHEA